ncbi:M24 family metallopeptidase [Corynebacterium tapiri]|uniref:Aminopeptidase P family protein n=1 Tax=Corynebacterium tapiri TaxID=1448266 RepID=A0A5C4U426_9CORY|nr:Xaa-Pro peptidase family protein [Corynebacterium tapiri]TNL97775.1 aminopeptidase P family protein [Corynebacterium tapiri]
MTFADTRFEDRRRRLGNEIAAQRLDYLLLTHLENIRYFSGFSGSNAALLIGKDRSAQICTDGRYTTQIAQEVPDIEAIIDRPSAAALLKRVEDTARVGVEASHLSLAEFDNLKSVAGENVTLVPVEKLIEPIREVKDEQELAELERVAAIAVDAFEALVADNGIRAGRTEREVAADLEYRMRLNGSERVSFDTIVASGPNSAKPHHSASDREIVEGDLVTIDFGAHSAGYNSDMTRTVIVGKVGETERKIYETVLRAQLAGVEAARAGMSLAEVDATCRDIIAEAGFGEYFTHSTGHGIGLDVHEAPFAARGAEGTLREGMTLTIEPGIYIPDVGGVRIEDTLVITSGDPRVITPVSKDLLIV